MNKNKNKGKSSSKSTTSNKKIQSNKNAKSQEKNNVMVNANPPTKSETVNKPTPVQSAAVSAGVPHTQNTAAVKKAALPKAIQAPAPPPDPVFVLRGAPCPVSSVQFLLPALRLDELTPSQREVLTASYGTTSEAGPGMPLLKLPPPGFLNPTYHLAAGLLNGQVIIWDLKTKQQCLCWQAHPQGSSVLCVKNVSATELITVGSKDALKLWYLEPAKDSDDKDDSGRLQYPAAATPVCRVQVPLADYLGFSDCDVFRHSNCIVAAVPGHDQDCASVWSLTDNVKICTLRLDSQTQVGSVMQLKWIEKRGTVALVVAYESGDVCLWNWTNTDLYSTVRVTGTPLCVEYDQSLGTGIIGTAQENVFLYTVSNNYEMTLLREITLVNEGIGCCISRPDSKIYITGGWDNKLRVFSWATSKLFAVLEFHSNSVSCLHYSSSRVATFDDGEAGAGVGPSTAGTEHMLAAGSLDGCISFWKIY